MRTRRETAPAKPGRPARFRALVRVLEADPQAGIFTVTVPAWGPDPLTVRYEDVPGEVRETVCPGRRGHVVANLAARSPDDLHLTDWTPFS